MLALAAVAPGLFSSQPITGSEHEGGVPPPSWAHPFGTDEGGRDIFARVVHGTRYSLGMALSIVLLAALFGTVYGAIAGFAGGWLDELMMRVVDVFLAFPAFVLAMAIAAAAGRGMRSVVIALAIIWWPGYARMIRGMVLGLKQNVWVDAARALGAPAPRLIGRHILPFTLGELNVRITVEIGYALVAVTSLSFIGLGAQRPIPEWGLLIADGRRYVTGAWWYPIFPGLAIYAATTDVLALRRRPGRADPAGAARGQGVRCLHPGRGDALTPQPPLPVRGRGGADRGLRAAAGARGGCRSVRWDEAVDPPDRAADAWHQAAPRARIAGPRLPGRRGRGRSRPARSGRRGGRAGGLRRRTREGLVRDPAAPAGVLLSAAGTVAGRG